MDIDQISTSIKDKGLSLTKARKSILNVMLTYNKPITGPEILSKLDGAMDESTVYRNLGVLEKVDIVACLQLDKKGVHYELKNPKAKHHHHHIVCNVCNKIVCLDICAVSGILNTLSKNTGFTDIQHSLEFYGTCKDCI